MKALPNGSLLPWNCCRSRQNDFRNYWYVQTALVVLGTWRSWGLGNVIATMMPSVSGETPSTRWLSLYKSDGLFCLQGYAVRLPLALLCRAVGAGS